MDRLNGFSCVDSGVVVEAAGQFGTPFYLYDEQVIKDKCAALLAMPHAYGLTVRFAMKANATKAILKLIGANGLHMDASSLNEVRRARAAGIPCENILLTTQETPAGQELLALREMILQGLRYNVCSLRQLRNIGDFAAENKIALSMRIHPGVGSGESVSRNTGDKYSCFGIHLSDIEEATAYAKSKGITIHAAHVHIGSGADPSAWQSNIDRELAIIDRHFPDARTVSFGGGLKEARMPGEAPADLQALGRYAKEKTELFRQKTNRKLHMEIEPGNFVMANAGYIVTTVIDKKQTGADGLRFVVLDGGMDLNIRPLLYAAHHPFYFVSKSGDLRFSEFADHRAAAAGNDYHAVLVGPCCESGDSQCLDAQGLNTPRRMREPEVGDFAIIGGAGAYCAEMSPAHYNSRLQAPEILFTSDRELKEIRVRETLAQLTQNER